MALLTIEESITGGAAAQASNAEREARARLVTLIENDFVLTVKDNVMEFTSPFSPIIPMVVVRGGISYGVAWMRTEAGPGQYVSANVLAACETVALGRLEANRAARLAEGQSN